MWQSYIFGMHWKHDGKLYYDELPAESKDEAAEYFITVVAQQLAEHIGVEGEAAERGPVRGQCRRRAGRETGQQAGRRERLQKFPPAHAPIRRGAVRSRP